MQRVLTAYFTVLCGSKKGQCRTGRTREERTGRAEEIEGKPFWLAGCDVISVVNPVASRITLGVGLRCACGGCLIRLTDSRRPAPPAPSSGNELSTSTQLSVLPDCRHSVTSYLSQAPLWGLPHHGGVFLGIVSWNKTPFLTHLVSILS